MKNSCYWKVSYRTALGESYVFISADSSYSDAKVIKILAEVHPEWEDLQSVKVDSLPFSTRKSPEKIKL
jgi:hypothetical protein